MNLQVHTLPTAAQNQDASDSLTAVVEVIAAGLAETGFKASAHTFTNQLATRLRCERVCFGLLRDQRCNVAVMSGSVSMDARTRLSTSISGAMDEAITQDATVVFPKHPNNKFQVASMHAQLAADHGARHICTIPFSHDGRLLGAVVMERDTDEPFDATALALCESVVAIMGPVFYRQSEDDRWFGYQIWRRVRASLQDTVAGRFSAATVIPLLLASGFLAASIVPANYRITAPAFIEGLVQRQVVAPMAGFVAEASVRAGDQVTKGLVLAQLEDEDFRLEHLKLVNEKSQLEQEYRGALVEHNSAKVQLLNARLAKVSASLALTEENLNRTRIVAPMDGIVVSGDLSQSLGAPVERGDVLFEVAPLDAQRVMLKVDEKEIRWLEQAQTGRLALVGFPGEYLPFTIKRITPVSTTEDGGNYFLVEADFSTDMKNLRPGMQGVGKIDAGTRTLLWIWFHKLGDWLRLQWWAF